MNHSHLDMESQNQLRVLHLPVNIASQISVTVRALRDIGVEARGIAVNSNQNCDDRGIENYDLLTRRNFSARSLFQTLSAWQKIVSALHWSNVVHWYYGNCILHLHFVPKYAALIQKVRIVEFWGSDIRIPEIASSDNPYMARMYKNGEGYACESYKNSNAVQKKFHNLGFECFIPVYELLYYLKKNLFPNPIHTKQRVFLPDYKPIYPALDKPRPLIVHAPSHKGAKGTEHVLNAIESLKNKFSFDFKLIHDVPRKEALNIVRDCDIMLDQFVIGEYGLSALEAMALGKPTVCYLKKSLIEKYPAEIPIIVADQENLIHKIKKLIQDDQFRHTTGRNSRAYVEKYHDAHKFAHELKNIYSIFSNNK